MPKFANFSKILWHPVLGFAAICMLSIGWFFYPILVFLVLASSFTLSSAILISFFVGEFLFYLNCKYAVTNLDKSLDNFSNNSEEILEKSDDFWKNLQENIHFNTHSLSQYEYDALKDHKKDRQGF